MITSSEALSRGLLHVMISAPVTWVTLNRLQNVWLSDVKCRRKKLWSCWQKRFRFSKNWVANFYRIKVGSRKYILLLLTFWTYRRVGVEGVGHEQFLSVQKCRRGPHNQLLDYKAILIIFGVFTCVYARTWVRMCVCTRAYVKMWTWTRECTCVCACGCVHTCVCVCTRAT